MHIEKRHTLSEPHAIKAAFNNDGCLDATTGKTPLDDLLEKEETPSGDEVAINKAKIESMRRLLLYCFGNTKDPLEALKTLYLLCYIIAPDALGNASLEDIARNFDATRQCFSKRLLKLNKELSIMSRNQKSTKAVEVSRQRAKAWHEAQKAEKAAARNLEAAKAKTAKAEQEAKTAKAKADAQVKADRAAVAEKKNAVADEEKKERAKQKVAQQKRERTAKERQKKKEADALKLEKAKKKANNKQS